jgi:hypothetical protein
MNSTPASLGSIRTAARVERTSFPLLRGLPDIVAGDLSGHHGGEHIPVLSPLAIGGSGGALLEADKPIREDLEHTPDPGIVAGLAQVALPDLDALRWKCHRF